MRLGWSLPARPRGRAQLLMPLPPPYPRRGGCPAAPARCRRRSSSTDRPPASVPPLPPPPQPPSLLPSFPPSLPAARKAPRAAPEGRGGEGGEGKREEGDKGEGVSSPPALSHIAPCIPSDPLISGRGTQSFGWRPPPRPLAPSQHPAWRNSGAPFLPAAPAVGCQPASYPGNLWLGNRDKGEIMETARGGGRRGRLSELWLAKLVLMDDLFIFFSGLLHASRRVK